MKLVDILARELKVWPKGAAALSQDGDGYVCGSSVEEFYDCTAEKWSGDADHYCELHQLSSDNKSAQVTQEQWQAAVDARKVESVQDWDGEGLPPVGIVCEMHRRSTEGFSKVRVEWIDQTNVLIRGLDTDYICKPFVELIEFCTFRPIRTPEQIREAAIVRLIKRYEEAAYTPRQMAEHAYDVLGYRDDQC